jgi:hypothetical protein
MMVSSLKPVGPRITKNFYFLKKLSRCCSDKGRWRLIKNADFDEILSVVEIAVNILSSNFCLTEKQRSRLRPFADAVRQLARKRSHKGAKKILIQTGGGAFFYALLSPIIAEAARYIVNKISSPSSSNSQDN